VRYEGAGAGDPGQLVSDEHSPLPLVHAAAVWLLVATPCMALECPAPQPAGTSGAIQETPAQISELSQARLRRPRQPDSVFVHALRSRHLNVPTGDLVNYLVTAYFARS
jgi:hypothetical protein